MIHTMVQNPKSDRSYLKYVFGAVLLLVVTAINTFFLVPKLDLSQFQVDNAAARNFVVDGASPYLSNDLKSQPDRSDSGGDVISSYHQPFYRTILRFPIATISDPAFAGGLWLTIFELSFAVILGIAAKLIFRGVPSSGTIAILFPILFLPGFWSATHIGDEVIVTLALLMLAIFSIGQQYDELAGVLLGLSFTLFEVFGIAFVTIFLWLIYQRRFRVFIGFFLTMALLLVTAHLFDPNWYIGYLKSQFAFYKQAPLFSTGGVFVQAWPGVGQTISKLISVIILAMLLYEWHTLFKRAFTAFLWVICLSLMIPPLLGFGYAAQFSVVSLIPIIMIVSRFSDRWKKIGFWISITILTIAEIWIIPALSQDYVGFRIIWLNVLIIGLLYWVRWDSVRTTRLWADILEDQGKI